MSSILSFFTNAKTWLLAILAGAVAIFLAYFKGRSSGVTEEKADNAAQVAKQSDQVRTEVRNVQNQVDSASDTAVTDELKRDWVRNDPSSGAS